MRMEYTDVRLLIERYVPTSDLESNGCLLPNLAYQAYAASGFRPCACTERDTSVDTLLALRLL